MPSFGPRTSVIVGRDSKNKSLVSYMLKRIAEHYGFSITKTLPQTRSKNGRIVVKRGSVMHGSIKVPVSNTAVTRKGNRKYHEIPMPAGMTILKIQSFLQKAKKNKPDHFVSIDGRSWPVN
ncbi:MAG: hypothetical protein F6K36_28465 [Symploca sp. SIO3C6]|nr:hypothetical protein [Symploca sp. SIO3C6]